MEMRKKVSSQKKSKIKYYFRHAAKSYPIWLVRRRIPSQLQVQRRRVRLRINLRFRLFFFKKPYSIVMRSRWRKRRLRVIKKTFLKLIFYRKRFQRKSKWRYLRRRRPHILFWFRARWPRVVGSRVFARYYRLFRNFWWMNSKLKRKLFSCKELKQLVRAEGKKKSKFKLRRAQWRRLRNRFLWFFVNPRLKRRKKFRRSWRYFFAGHVHMYHFLRHRWLITLASRKLVAQRRFLRYQHRYRSEWRSFLARVRGRGFHKQRSRNRILALPRRSFKKKKRWHRFTRVRVPARKISYLARRQGAARTLLRYPGRKKPTIPVRIPLNKKFRALSSFGRQDVSKFRNYYKLCVLFKKVLRVVYGFTRAAFPPARFWKKNFRRMKQLAALQTSRVPRKKAVVFFRYYELQLPVVLLRFFLIGKLAFAVRIIQLHGVLVNNRLITKPRTRIHLGDLVECSFKSYLYFEVFFTSMLSVSRNHALSWLYTYCFVVNCILLAGLYFRCPNPLFIPFMRRLRKKQKKKFLYFFIEYLAAR